MKKKLKVISYEWFAISISIIMCIIISLGLLITSFGSKNELSIRDKPKIATQVNLIDFNAMLDKKEEKVKKKKKNNVKPKKKKYLITRGLPSPRVCNKKTYMDYRTITNKNSSQWKLQMKSHTDKNGLRKIGKYYTVAMGTFYSKSVGDKFRITLSNGRKIWVITGDIKQNAHTDNKHQYAVASNNVVEFIVDSNRISRMSRIMGDISYTKGFKGRIVKIEEVNYGR